MKNVIICGLAATGKSVLAKEIAKKVNKEYLSSSTLLKGMMGHNYDKEDAFWDKKGMSLFKERKKKNFDKELDNKQIALAEKGGYVFDTWVLAWLYKGDAIKVLITASDKERAKRMAGRDKVSEKEALKVLKKRDKKTAKIFANLYSIDIYNDRKPFDLVVNTDYLNQKEALEYVNKYLDYVSKK